MDSQGIQSFKVDVCQSCASKSAAKKEKPDKVAALGKQNFYCSTCKLLICIQCLYLEHQIHEFEYLSKIITQIVDTLQIMQKKIEIIRFQQKYLVNQNRCSPTSFRELTVLDSIDEMILQSRWIVKVGAFLKEFEECQLKFIEQQKTAKVELKLVDRVSRVPKGKMEEGKASKEKRSVFKQVGNELLCYHQDFSNLKLFSWILEKSIVSKMCGSFYQQVVAFLSFGGLPIVVILYAHCIKLFKIGEGLFEVGAQFQIEKAPIRLGCSQDMQFCVMYEDMVEFYTVGTNADSFYMELKQEIHPEQFSEVISNPQIVTEIIYSFEGTYLLFATQKGIVIVQIEGSFYKKCTFRQNLHFTQVLKTQTQGHYFACTNTCTYILFELNAYSGGEYKMLWECKSQQSLCRGIRLMQDNLVIGVEKEVITLIDVQKRKVMVQKKELKERQSGNKHTMKEVFKAIPGNRGFEIFSEKSKIYLCAVVEGVIQFLEIEM